MNKYFILAGDNAQEKVEGVHFLFPLKSFCVGVKKEYELDEIAEGSYLYMNRILDEEAIENLESQIQAIEKKCKGIFFEDLGVLQILEEKNSSLESIFMPSHMICSKESAKSFLKEASKVVLSPDITLEESKFILEGTQNIGVLLYGHLPFMYSRRTLLKNYAKNFELEEEKTMMIDENIHQKRFFAVENDYGTVIYDSKVYDGRELLGHASFYVISLEFEHIKSIKEFLKELESGKEIEDSTTGFLHQKTIYKLPPKKGEQHD